MINAQCQKQNKLQNLEGFPDKLKKILISSCRMIIVDS